MSTRLKSLVTISTRTLFDEEVDNICRLQLDREQLVILRDRLLMEILEAHNPEIERISQDIAENLCLCEKFAITHRESLFGKLKSAAASLGIFGFRTGNPKLALLSRKWKWADVLAALQSSGLSHLIRTKIEPDKEALKKLDEIDLFRIGLRIDQDETFFIEPIRQNPERIQS